MREMNNGIKRQIDYRYGPLKTSVDKIHLLRIMNNILLFFSTFISQNHKCNANSVGIPSQKKRIVKGCLPQRNYLQGIWSTHYRTFSQLPTLVFSLMKGLRSKLWKTTLYISALLRPFQSFH